MALNLIFLSGWANPAESLSILSDRLADKFKVYTLSVHDLTGFAAEYSYSASKTVKANTGSFPLSLYAQGLICFIEKINNPCVLIGFSAGGLAALEAASSCHGMIKGLILINTTARFCSDSDYRFGLSPSRLRAVARGLRKDTKNVLTEFFKDASAPFKEEPLALETKAEGAVLIGIDKLLDGLQYLRSTDLRNSLERIFVPSLVLHGKEDIIIPWQAGKYIAEKIQNNEWVLLQDIGHDLPFRCPKFVGDRILKLINGQNGQIIQVCL